MTEETAIRIAEALERIASSTGVSCIILLAIALLLFLMLTCKDMGGK